MSRQTRNQDLVVVGKDIASITANPISMNALADGEVRLYTPEGALIEAVAAGGSVAVAADMTFVVAIGGPNGKPKFVSEPINGAIVNYVTKTGAAGAEQLDYIGYNGASGSIDEIDNNLYMVSAYVEEYLTASSDGRYIKHFQFKSKTTGAIQPEIALGLAKSGIENWSREAKNVNGDSFMGFKALCNVALGSDFVFDATFEITGTKRSNTLNVAAATPTYDTGTALAVGDYLRIGTAAGATGAAVALVSDVYKVVALPTTTTITLDRPLQTDSGSYLIADGSITVVTAALGDAADWGVGVNANVKDHVTGKEFYKKNRFTLILGEDFGSTTITKDTLASRGIGVIEDVRDHEWFSAGNQGEIYRMGEPVIHNFVSNVDITSGEFDTATLQWTDGHLVGFQDEMSPKLLTIYSPNSNDPYMTDGTDGTSAMLAAIVA
jgi:hypothetical protein